MKKILAVFFFILFIITALATPFPSPSPEINTTISEIILKNQNGEFSSLNGLVELRKILNQSYEEWDQLLVTTPSVTLNDQLRELALSLIPTMGINFLDFFIVVFGNHDELSPSLDLDTQRELLLDFFLDEFNQYENYISKDLLVNELLKQLSVLLFPRDEHNLINNQLKVFWKTKLQPCNDNFSKLSLYRPVLESLNNDSFQYILSGCFDAYRVHPQHDDLTKDIFFDYVSTYNKETISETIFQSMNQISEAAIEDFSYDNVSLNKLIKILSLYEKISNILITDHYKFNIFYLDNLQSLYSKIQVLIVDKKTIIKSSLFTQATPYLQLYLLKASMDLGTPITNLLNQFDLETHATNLSVRNEFNLYFKSLLTVEYLRFQLELSKIEKIILKDEEFIIRKIKDTIFHALQIRFDNTNNLDDLLGRGLPIFAKEIINEQQFLTINRCNSSACQDIVIPPGIYGGENIKINCKNLEFHPLSYFYSPSNNIEINCKSIKNVFIDVSGKNAQPPITDTALIKFYLNSPLPVTKQVGNDVVIDWFEGTQDLFNLKPVSLAHGLNGSHSGNVKIISDQSYGINLILASGSSGTDGIDGIDSRLWNKETNTFTSLVLDTGNYWVENRTERVCWMEDYPCEGEGGRHSRCDGRRQRCENRVSHITHFNKQPTSITIYPLQAGNGGNGGAAGTISINKEIAPKIYAIQKGGNGGVHGRLPHGDVKDSIPSHGYAGASYTISLIKRD